MEFVSKKHDICVFSNVITLIPSFISIGSVGRAQQVQENTLMSSRPVTTYACIYSSGAFPRGMGRFL
jgi:hypothetical protein